MRELVVLSGKGGTGKTSLTASFAFLSGRAVMADTDVDGSNLPLLFDVSVRRRESFYSGEIACVTDDLCVGCGRCESVCRFGAVHREGDRPRPKYKVDPLACEGCGFCYEVCPSKAVKLQERLTGEWFEFETRAGPLVHARLAPSGENSGKLVGLVKREARRIAKERNLDLVLVDGPPGIGCPVIASLGGVSGALFVAEPTVSGLHDFERAANLTAHFGIGSMICVNRWDLNPSLTERLEERARSLDVHPVGRVRYDRSVTQAQREGRSVVERESPAAADIRNLWKNLEL
ncbi:MAG TPA: ATP-binding protein [Elusimicrobiota bacterium]|nr:ATP-binding protein [Elusimicrobiota bacterium]